MKVRELMTRLADMCEDEAEVKFSYVYDAVETVESDIDSVEWDGTDVILKG